MLAIFSATVPIYSVLLLGYLSTRFGLFQREDMAIFGRLVTKVALPCLIFLAVSQRSITEVLNPTYLLSYVLGAMIMFGLAFGYAKVRGYTAVKGTFLAMGVGGVNSGFVGLPLFLLVLPSFGSLAIGMNMIADNVVFLPLLLGLAAHFSAQGDTLTARMRATVFRLVTNPLFVAIGLALLVSAFGVGIPAALGQPISLLAQAATGLALFTVGGMLHGLPVRTVTLDLFLAVVSKLVLHPIVVGLALMALLWLGFPGMETELVAAVILAGALPAMSMYPSLALEYGEGDFAAAVMAVTTVASFVTLSGWLFLLQAIGYL